MNVLDEGFDLPELEPASAPLAPRRLERARVERGGVELVEAFEFVAGKGREGEPRGRAGAFPGGGGRRGREGRDGRRRACARLLRSDRAGHPR